MSCEVCEENCCLIDYGCIIQNTPLNTFSDEKDVMNSLILAQPQVVTDLLGDDCYEQLCQIISDGTIGDTGNEKWLKLKKAIEKPLSWLTFKFWVEFYADVTYGDSATSTATDRSSTSFSNITVERQDKLMKSSISRYENFVNEARKKIDKLDLDCLPKDEDDCTKSCNDDKGIDDYLSHLPDVV